ncbi:hypothetical protein Tdes44962_MAKER01317 [Teratosphaeria destructans]|uniref:Uncharacterized protein n=1 Tax=Teratosphaeria destructans TaxID=418781 RepID=A0A9W7T0M1_9PEZI|nr:hypothetical protein Tdes44962_MAKER01317 [Teratosphaeria destructans]
MRAIPSRPPPRQHRNTFTYLDTPTRMRSLPDPARARSCSLVVITEPDTAIDDRFDQSSLNSGIGLTGPEWSFKARKVRARSQGILGV